MTNGSGTPILTVTTRFHVGEGRGRGRGWYPWVTCARWGVLEVVTVAVGLVGVAYRL